MYSIKETALLLGVDAETAVQKLAANGLRPDNRNRYRKKGVETLRLVGLVLLGVGSPPVTDRPGGEAAMMTRLHYLRLAFAAYLPPLTPCRQCLARAVRAEATLLSVMPGQAYHLHIRSNVSHWLCRRCAKQYKELFTRA